MTRHFRIMTSADMIGLQGFPKGRLQWKGLLTETNRKVSERQFNLMIGNTMSVPVVGRLMRELLILIRKVDAHIPDPWARKG